MTAWGDAACRDHDPELWFPEGYDSALNARQEREAKRICRGCPVKLACLQLALDNEPGIPGRYRSGIFGGLNGRERKALDPKRSRFDVEDHGSAAAYQRHMRAGEPPCGPCRVAQGEYRRRLGRRPVESLQREPA